MQPPRGGPASGRAWVGGTVALVLVLVAGATAGYAWYLNHEIHRIPLHNLSRRPARARTPTPRTS